MSDFKTADKVKINNTLDLNKADTMQVDGHPKM